MTKTTAIAKLIKHAIIFVIALIIGTSIAASQDFGSASLGMGFLLAGTPFGFMAMRRIILTLNPVVLAISICLGVAIGWIAAPVTLIKDVYNVVRA